MVEYILITSTTCPKCLDAKQFIKDMNIKCKILEVDMDEKAMDFALSCEINSLPAFVKKEGDKNTVLTFDEFKDEIIGPKCTE